MKYEKKQIETTERGFYFPNADKTIEANSLEEAEKKLNKKTK